MSNSSAGLADSAKRSRIKRKAVRPPVAGRPVLGAQPSQTQHEPQVSPIPAPTAITTAPEAPVGIKEPLLVQPVSTSEPSEVSSL